MFPGNEKIGTRSGNELATRDDRAVVIESIIVAMDHFINDAGARRILGMRVHVSRSMIHTPVN